MRFNMKGAAWDSFFLTIVKFVTILTSILQTKILSVGFSLTDYGTYSQANIVVSIFTSLLLLGLSDAIVYFYNDKSGRLANDDKIRVINTIFAIEMIAGIALVLLVFIGRDFIANYFSNDALKTLIVIVSIKPMLDNLIYFYQVLFISTGKAKLIAVRNLIISFSKVIFIFLAVHVFQGVEYIYISLILLDLLQLIFFFVAFSKNDFRVSPIKSNFSYFREIINYSLPMGIFALTNALTRELDKLVVSNLSNTETVAVYSNCSKVLPIDIIVISFATVLIPYIMKYISQHKYNHSITLFKNYLKIGYYTVWTFGTALLIVSRQAISFLYSPQYLVGESIFIIYVVDSMVKFASMHLILTASGNAKILMRYSIMSLIFNLLFNVLFFRLFGVIGPAIATLVVTVLYTFAILIQSAKILQVNLLQLFEFKDLTLFVVVLTFCFILFNQFNSLLLGNGLNEYIAMILTICGYCSIVFLVYGKHIFKVIKSINSLKIT